MGSRMQAPAHGVQDAPSLLGMPPATSRVERPEKRPRTESEGSFKPIKHESHNDVELGEQPGPATGGPHSSKASSRPSLQRLAQIKVHEAKHQVSKTRDHEQQLRSEMEEAKRRLELLAMGVQDQESSLANLHSSIADQKGELQMVSAAFEGSEHTWQAATCDFNMAAKQLGLSDDERDEKLLQAVVDSYKVDPSAVNDQASLEEGPYQKLVLAIARKNEYAGMILKAKEAITKEEDLWQRAAEAQGAAAKELKAAIAKGSVKIIGQSIAAVQDKVKEAEEELHETQRQEAHIAEVRAEYFGIASSIPREMISQSSSDLEAIALLLHRQRQILAEELQYHHWFQAESLRQHRQMLFEDFHQHRQLLEESMRSLMKSFKPAWQHLRDGCSVAELLQEQGWSLQELVESVKTCLKSCCREDYQVVVEKLVMQLGLPQLRQCGLSLQELLAARITGPPLLEVAEAICGRLPPQEEGEVALCIFSGSDLQHLLASCLESSSAAAKKISRELVWHSRAGDCPKESCSRPHGTVSLQLVSAGEVASGNADQLDLSIELGHKMEKCKEFSLSLTLLAPDGSHTCKQAEEVPQEHQRRRKRKRSAAARPQRFEVEGLLQAQEIASRTCFHSVGQQHDTLVMLIHVAS